ncbi:MAG: beta-propeller fold lactonase family protein [Nitrospinota bacterium]
MKNIKILSFIILIISLVSCTALQRGERGVADSGNLVIYLSSSTPPPPYISFTISAIDVQKGDEEWLSLGDLSLSINTTDLFEKQIPVGEFYLPEGRYKRLRLRLSKAVLKRDDESFNLAIPRPAGEVILHTKFEIKRDDIVPLFMEWDAGNSVEDGYMFRPAITIRTRMTEIKHLLSYVTNTGSNSVSVIDRELGKVIGIIRVDRRPKGITANSTGDRVYVINSRSNTISVIDTANNEVMDTISLITGIEPTEVVLLPDDETLYVSNFGSDDVSVVSTVSRNLITTIPVGHSPLEMATGLSGRRVYVSNSISNTISVIDTYSNEVVNTISGVGLRPRGMLITEDVIYVVSQGSNRISVIDINSNRVIKMISAGLNPLKLSMGLLNRIYVTSQGSDNVNIIHLTSGTITGEISVGRLPVGLSFDRDRNRLYVVNKGSDTISVLDILSERVIETIYVGKGPYEMVLIR